MPTHHRKLKLVTFSLGTPAVQFECQLNNWNVANNTEDGEKRYTYCPDGEYREETDPDYALELTFDSDWRENGISDFLTTHDGEEAAFVLDHHPDVAAEHVRWDGTCVIKAPNVGGEARTTEQTEVTLLILGKPEYTRVGA